MSIQKGARVLLRAFSEVFEGRNTQYTVDICYSTFFGDEFSQDEPIALPGKIGCLPTSIEEFPGPGWLAYEKALSVLPA
jgi:hypothetical protein